MLCPNCNTENVDTAKFCNECGARLDAAEGVSGNTTAILETLPSIPSPEPDIAGVISDPFAPGRVSWASGGTLELPKIPKEPESDVSEDPALEDFDFEDEEPSSVDLLAKQGKGSSKSPEKNPGKRKRSLLIALLVVVVAAAVVFGTYALELWGGHAVPDVTGMTQDSATELLQEKGFTVRPLTVPSDDTEGIILLTDPEPGARLADGSEVSIFAAIPRTIPEVVGKSTEEAQKALTESGYENVTVQKKKSNKKEGTVLSIDPEAGTEVKSTSEVTLTVADPYRVPDVTGMTEGKAIKAVSKAGFDPEVDYSYTEEADEGTVVGVEPAVGTVAKSGSRVVVIVAKSRATEVVELMWNIFYGGREIVVDGTSYLVSEVNSVEYQSDDTASYSITAEPFTYLLGERVTLDPREVTGTVTWDSENNISDASPALELG